ncbi:MAG: hypothetical protein KDD40_06700, partial [Bdellovibrionales bacterium]|nr:hypothetical protein [Bdellovibrionales bacterium]
MKFFAKAKKCEQVHNNKTLNKIFPNFNGIIFESLFAMILNTALKRFRQLLLYTLILFNTHLGWAVTGKVSRYSDSCLESL